MKQQVHSNRPLLAVLPGLAVAAALGACEAETRVPVTGVVDDAPLTDLGSLLEGAPPPGSVVPEPKTDRVLPTHFDLVALQSPVKSQGGRGVCSIFSTTALMEHLYIKADFEKTGHFEIPDFSEQFLLWSVKFEHGAHPNALGSDERSNLDTIRLFGVVEEDAAPYESSPWTTADDPRCTGSRQPTECYTNGRPSERALQAPRWHLPRAKWIAGEVYSIKAHMVDHGTAVLASGPVFYQAWNHRLSTLPVSAEQWSQGYVTWPNDRDVEESATHSAGHSVLLVGWDDTLTVPLLDEHGAPRLDDEGRPMEETGFFLFKNSWGTSSFGAENPHGAGYGWLSMRYVERHMNINSAGVPWADEICTDGVDDNGDGNIDCDDPKCADDAACVSPVELCDDGVDNDDNGQVDCDDAACVEEDVCYVPPPPSLEGSATVDTDIPDADPAGLSSSIVLDGPGDITGLEIAVDITHAYQGDLVVRLRHPDGETVMLHENEGRNAENLVHTYEIADFNGKPAAGEWHLEVADLYEGDAGRLNRWSLRVFLPE